MLDKLTASPKFLSSFLNKIKFIWDFAVLLQEEAMWLPLFATNELPAAILAATVKWEDSMFINITTAKREIRMYFLSCAHNPILQK